MTTSETDKVAAGREAPGPRGWAALRAAVEFFRNDLTVLERVAAKYGDVVQLRFFGWRIFLLNHPDHVQRVLMDNRTNYLKLPGPKIVQKFFGDAMQTNNGDAARQLRMLLAPVFHPDRVTEVYGGIAMRAAVVLADSWTAGPRTDLAQELMDLALGIAVQIHFGTEPGAETQRVGRVLTDALSALRLFMLPAWVPTSGNRRYMRALAALDAEVFARVAAARASGAGRSDLLGTLAQLRLGDGWALGERQVRDEIVSMMAAGFQSMGIAIGQTLRLVAEHPAVEARLVEEVARDEGTDFAEAIVKESLRLCPPAGALMRRAERGDTMGGWRVPAGARVLVAPWSMQRDDRFFPEPLVFRPERWTAEFERKLPLAAYFPFGRGPRGCIASALSSLIVRTVLVTIVTRCRLEALQVIPAAESTWPGVLRRGGLKIAVHPRVIAKLANRMA
jgi:cytochrome P450